MRVTVRKRNLQNEITWSYDGLLLEQTPEWVRLEARFNRPEMPFMGIVLREGDRFVETFFASRWYNIFEIHDVETDALKGWYCNLARPMVWDEPETLSYVDLALDLWVTPQGVQRVLDEDEFAALSLDPGERALALEWMERLRAYPFRAPA